jgi:methylated-DNA-protein-cysteine methyltransferase-like protein
MLNMRDFSEQIYTQIANIPKGKVSTYGDIANAIGYKGYARQVGKCLSQLPSNTTLPWHRVINGQGKLSLTGERGLQQKARLTEENIEISDNGRVNLRRYRW